MADTYHKIHKEHPVRKRSEVELKAGTYDTEFYRFYCEVLSPWERRDLCDQLGLSYRYMQKNVYVTHGKPRFQLHTAIKLHAITDGAFPVWEYAQRCDEIDWQFLGTVMRSAGVRGIELPTIRKTKPARRRSKGNMMNYLTDAATDFKRSIDEEAKTNKGEPA